VVDVGHLRLPSRWRREYVTDAAQFDLGEV
jgi:hypothetical protein